MADQDAQRLAWPVTLGPDGRLATVAQDSDADIGQCIRLVLEHRPGDRPDLPEMGVLDPSFGEELDVDGIVAQVTRHEPRATVRPQVMRDVLDEFTTELQLEWDRPASAQPPEA